MIDNEKIKEEVLNFLGDHGLKMVTKFYKEHKNVFPLIVEDGIPISINMYLGRPLRNHIRQKFPEIDDKMDYCQYEDYIYNMVMKIAKENGEI